MSKVSAEELHRLYHDEDLNQRQIGEKIDVTQASVPKWMSKYNIKSDIADPWSKEEEKILNQNYPGDKSKISDLLPKRSWNAIKLKAMAMGLARNQEEYRQSKEVAKKCRKLAEENEIKVKLEEKEALSYVLGVIHGDGFHDNKGTVGLEVKDEVFADKFIENLCTIGLNPNKGKRDSKTSVWASSKILVEWLQQLCDIKGWLVNKGDIWKYLEGQYDSDGNLYPSGSPRICSYNDEEKRLISELFEEVGLKHSIQQNNVWVSINSRSNFFENLNPVLERRRGNTS